jgi:hypothetical protein
LTKLSDITGHAFSTAAAAAAVDVDSVTVSPFVPTATLAAAVAIVFVSSAAVSSVAALRNISPPPLLLHFIVPWMSSDGANALTVPEEDVTAMTIAVDTMKNFIIVWLCGFGFCGTSRR